MSQTIPQMRAKGLNITDLTEKNWHLNTKNLAQLVSRIQESSADALSVLVLDLFGNTSVHFWQADNTLSLAVKLPGEGGWHLLGDVVYTPDDILREQVKLLSCLEINLKNRAKIFIPPILRFVFGSCCSSDTNERHQHTHTIAPIAFTSRTH